MTQKNKIFASVLLFSLLFLIVYFGVYFDLKNKPVFAQTKKETTTPVVKGTDIDTVTILSKDAPPVAVYKGKEIRISDMENREFLNEMVKFYSFIENNIFQQVIKQESTDPEFNSQLSKIKVSDKEIKKFYDSEKLNSQGTLEQLKEPIRNHLIENKRGEFVMSFIDRALNSGELILNIKKPQSPVTETGVEDSIITVQPKSNVALVEYSDFQCPFCNKVQNALQQLKKEFPNIGFFYKHFPLNIHPEADEAAIASECAYQQGKFEQYKSVLFNNQKAQYEKNLFEYAKKIVPDYAAFEKCYRTQNLREKINKQIKEGSEIGINGTPGFVVGIYDENTKTVSGTLLSGALPIDTFRKVIEKYLNK